MSKSESKFKKYRQIKRATELHLKYCETSKNNSSSYSSGIAEQTVCTAVFDAAQHSDNDVGIEWHSDEYNSILQENLSFTSNPDTQQICNEAMFEINSEASFMYDSDGSASMKSSCCSDENDDGSADRPGLEYAEIPEDEPNDFAERIKKWSLIHHISHSALSDLLKILKEKDDKLPMDARSLLQTRNVCHIVKMKDLLGGDGEFVYFGLETQIKNNLGNLIIESRASFLELLLNIDGIPVSRSSTRQFWPILCSAVMCDELSKPFVVAIFSGFSKPASVNAYLKDLIDELKQLCPRGINIDGIHVTLKIKGFICDAPARAFLKVIKGHGGFYGCERCEQKGTYDHVAKKVIFPELHSANRTDESFNQKLQKEHHKGTSPLLALDIGLVSQFPLEYMHLICLGAVKKLLLLWLHGSCSFHACLSQTMARAISDDMSLLANHICCEFARKPRMLRELDRWKAVELRLFLLYVGPVVLRSVLADEYYHHFMLLHHSVVILVNKSFSVRYCEVAEELLKQFVSELPALYGHSVLVYTMHSLIHICDDVRLFGPLDCYSAFGFENKLGQLKRLLRSGNKPLQQICRRLSENSASCMQSMFEPVFSITCGQRAFISYRGFKFSCTNEADRFAKMSDDRIVRIDDIKGGDCIGITCRYFRRKEPFYSYPQHSDIVGICRVSMLSDDVVQYTLDDVITKCMLLPRKQYFVCFPLLHFIC